MSFRPRWYRADVFNTGSGAKWWEPEQVGIVAISGIVHRAGSPYGYLKLPEELIRLAQDEYDLQFPGQPYERMQARGGLGLMEMVLLLADALERERARRR